MQVEVNTGSAWYPPKGHTFLNKPHANTMQQKKCSMENISKRF